MNSNTDNDGTSAFSNIYYRVQSWPVDVVHDLLRIRRVVESMREFSVESFGQFTPSVVSGIIKAQNEPAAQQSPDGTLTPTEFLNVYLATEDWRTDQVFELVRLRQFYESQRKRYAQGDNTNTEQAARYQTIADFKTVH